jgi:hypothetical protein
VLTAKQNIKQKQINKPDEDTNMNEPLIEVLR